MKACESSSDTLKSYIDLPLDPKVLEDLVEKAKEYALMHGICMRRKEPYDRDSLHFAPFVLFPSAFPRDEFDKAIQIQTLFNELMHKVAHDHEFLTETLSKTIQVDEFTRKLFEIYEIVYKEGFTQKNSLGMLRSDYMVDSSDRPLIKQVETNTIASGFGWLGPASNIIHRYILGELGRRDLQKNIPENGALAGLSGAMIEAWKIYSVPKSVILFVVEDVSYNVCDQRFHEFKIRELNPDIRVIRKSLTQIYEQGKLSKDNRLIIDEDEVAVIYFRCGYSPDQYPTLNEWDARLMMERSLAIKSPSIHYHLAGTKKVQQVLANPQILEKFFSGEPDKVELLRSVFTGLYTLDDNEEGNKIIEKVLADPNPYVMKPQREGGGNNLYGEEIKPFLESIKDTDERNAYIIMDRICPPLSKNYMVRPGSDYDKIVDVVSELGIFGYIIGDKEKIITNKQVGHMLRTKLSNVNEGGVAAGLGALDSVILLDKKDLL